MLSHTARMVDPAVAAEALAGLRSAPKTLPPKLFYDNEGCRLFGLITELPEYYVTRAELALLERIAPRIAACVPTGAMVVEYGAGSEAKAALLLRALRQPKAYVPVDVAGPAVRSTATRMATIFPDLKVQPVVGDFLAHVELPGWVTDGAPLGFFPGSTIGNLSPDTAITFMAQARQTLGSRAKFLIGVDLRKDPSLLIPAYADSQGVTAAFNLNVLARLNREAAADFDLSCFTHRAIWNDSEGRIEMHLVSQKDQSVTVAGETIRFSENETIHTENSYKHTVESFRDLAERAGWRPMQLWTGPEPPTPALVSLHLLEAAI